MNVALYCGFSYKRRVPCPIVFGCSVVWCDSVKCIDSLIINRKGPTDLQLFPQVKCSYSIDYFARSSGYTEALFVGDRSETGHVVVHSESLAVLNNSPQLRKRHYQMYCIVWTPQFCTNTHGCINVTILWHHCIFSFINRPCLWYHS